MKLRSLLKSTSYQARSKISLKPEKTFVSIKEIEVMIKNLLTKKTPGEDDLIGGFYQTFIKEVT